ncbi:MAG: Mps1-like Thr/Tyr dual specificity protein kinase [Amphiamblys sp. WSBS2006]|nr:MAG: Mps1-like Thr/Tyr dual specificity protein kinase [Amphiamblys sp. WSBS2006]
MDGWTNKPGKQMFELEQKIRSRSSTTENGFQTDLAEELYRKALTLDTPEKILSMYTKELENPDSARNREIWVHYIFIHYRVTRDIYETRSLLKLVEKRMQSTEFSLLRAYIEARNGNRERARAAIAETEHPETAMGVLDSTIDTVSPSLGKIKRTLGCHKRKEALEAGNEKESTSIPSSLQRHPKQPKQKDEAGRIRKLALSMPEKESLVVQEETEMELTATAKKENSPTKNTPRRSSLRVLLVNGKPYHVLSVIGKGGSSRVLRVLSETGEILALKRIGLKGLEPHILEGYKNEIELLKTFVDRSNIIRMTASEINTHKNTIHILMECGEIDLATMLRNKMSFRDGVCDQNFVRYCWEQILLAVGEIHTARIVHCDLKPANFVMVKGRLKLIDFGISKAIRNDTTNILRESQVGTVNYMSPEALVSPSDSKNFKLGRSSDIWSLGCILYEMCYGEPPFASFNLMARFSKITDPAHEIPFPPLGNTFLLDTLKGCLRRSPKTRLSLSALLTHPFLFPENFL